MNQGRLIGIIAMVIGFGMAILGGLWLATQVGSGELAAGGAVIGGFLLFVPVAIVVGFGIYMFVQGGQEQERESQMRQQRQLLDIVKSRGQVKTHELAIELNADVERVRSMVHELVGLQVFSGYIDWSEGTLYSEEASNLRDLDACKNCGGAIELSGKGIAKCKYCGTEYFLT